MSTFLSKQGGSGCEGYIRKTCRRRRFNCHLNAHVNPKSRKRLTASFTTSCRNVEEVLRGRQLVVIAARTERRLTPRVADMDFEKRRTRSSLHRRIGVKNLGRGRELRPIVAGRLLEGMNTDTASSISAPNFFTINFGGRGQYRVDHVDMPTFEIKLSFHGC